MNSDMSSLYYVSPSSSSSSSSTTTTQTNLLTLLQNGKILEISSRYKKHWGYILSAYCQKKIMSPETQYLLEYMSYSLSTDVGKRVLEEFSHHYDSAFRNVVPKFLAFTLDDFERNPNLDGISEDIIVDVDLETNKEFLQSGFRKGWTKYLTNTDLCLHSLLEVLSDRNMNPEPYLNYLAPIKTECFSLDLSIQEFDLLCKLLPNVGYSKKFCIGQYAYMLGIFDFYVRYSTLDSEQEEMKLREIVIRALFQAMSNKEGWVEFIKQQNKERLDIELKRLSILYPDVEIENFIKNTQDVLCEEILDYQPFDIYFHHTIGGNVYLFSRPEFQTLIEKKMNIYTREPIALSVLGDVCVRMTHANEVNIHDPAILEDLLELIPKRISLEHVLTEIQQESKDIDKTSIDVLTFMYGNYSIWVHHYLEVSSTIYSFLYRCFRYWHFLHEIDNNYITSVCIDTVGIVQKRFPHMSDKDCVVFILSSQHILERDDEYKYSFINFCANWYRFYNLRKNNIEMRFVYDCKQMLNKYSQKQM